MANIQYLVNSNNYQTEETVNLSVGDSFKVVTYTDSNSYGIFSPSGVSKLVGDFPPEIEKTTEFWTVLKSSRYIMKSFVQLNTPGTYTMQKVGTTKVGKYITIIVARTSPTIPVNVSGAWKNSEPLVNVGGDWKAISNAYVNVSNEWKEI